ncbi:MAG: 50S ribosomal protein L15 [Phycisphaerales bacterium]|nr:50S ribosomal protein L15 [Phycisphaerales bacterium]
MMIHEITEIAGKNKKRKRVGRGPGSGRGKTSTRGFKGAGSRTGNSRRYAFEGGQMPYFRRMPKFGFTNVQFRTLFWAVNLGDIVKHPDFAKGGRVDDETLIKSGLVRDSSRDVKILGDLKADAEDAKLTVALDVEVSRVTAGARAKILEAGGKVNELGTRRDRVRGVDRNSDDHTPKNLTKKLKRLRQSEANKAAFARGEAPKKKG